MAIRDTARRPFPESGDNNDNISIGIDLPFRLTLIVNLGQVYYDTKIFSVHNVIDSMMNFGLNLNYSF